MAVAQRHNAQVARCHCRGVSSLKGMIDATQRRQIMPYVIPMWHVELCGMYVMPSVERGIDCQLGDSQAMIGLSPGAPKHTVVTSPLAC